MFVVTFATCRLASITTFAVTVPPLFVLNELFARVNAPLAYIAAEFAMSKTIFVLDNKSIPFTKT